MAQLLLGVTGSIAAYKACELVRLLVREGHQVQVVLTPFARQFVGSLTFSALTGRPCYAEFSEEASFHHLNLARAHELFCIAPCDANTLSKLAQGIGDNLLTTTALAFPGPMAIAPAMNSQMWSAPPIRENLQVLQNRGALLIPPQYDVLACGDEGIGKMAEPSSIVHALHQRLALRRSLVGKKVLISAGATREPLDPVRFISNGSSGKMGQALAQEALARGAEVFAVLGAVEASFSGIPHLRAKTCDAMKKALIERMPWADIIVMAAAVADFKPKVYAQEKLERKETLSLTLEPTEDIARLLGEQKNGKILVGFCLSEEKSLLQNAEKKRTLKQLDLVVANPVTAIEKESTSAYLLTEKEQKALKEQNKRELAAEIFSAIENLLRRQA